MLAELIPGTHIGEFDADGSVKTDVSHCALSGRFLRSIHSTRYRIAGTPYFYRVLTDAAPRGLSDDQRAALDAQVLATVVGKSSKAKGSKAPPADAVADEQE